MRPHLPFFSSSFPLRFPSSLPSLDCSGMLTRVCPSSLGTRHSPFSFLSLLVFLITHVVFVLSFSLAASWDSFFFFFYFPFHCFFLYFFPHFFTFSFPLTDCHHSFPPLFFLGYASFFFFSICYPSLFFLYLFSFSFPWSFLYPLCEILDYVSFPSRR